jgi:hypothetical protein
VSTGLVKVGCYTRSVAKPFPDNSAGLGKKFVFCFIKKTGPIIVSHFCVISCEKYIISMQWKEKVKAIKLLQNSAPFRPCQGKTGLNSATDLFGSAAHFLLGPF